MACNSITVPSPISTDATKFLLKEYNGLRLLDSGKGPCKQASMRRSYSDHHLCYSINRIRTAATKAKLKNSPSYGIFQFQISSSIIPNSLRSYLFDPETGRDMDGTDKDVDLDESLEESVEGDEDEEIERANWVERLLEIRSRWRSGQPKGNTGEVECCDVDEERNCNCDEDENGCAVDYNSEESERGEIKYGRETFSRILAQVSWSDTKLFSKLAFLCNMAYVIPDIKANDLRRYYGLHFVTSSLEKKAEAAAIKAMLDQDSTHLPLVNTDSCPEKLESLEQKRPMRSWMTYEIAASAASYVHARAKGLLSGSSKSEGGDGMDSNETVQPAEDGESSPRVYKSEVAAYVAASTMTTVVAAGEKEKQKVAKDLQTLHSSPCEWFVCDDLSTYTRHFVIQGSDSLASWLANLFFEPTEFEGTEVLVHRGIYEAAKGIYEQFMPEIIKHLNKYGERAKLQFTGHSLGGSLSLLVNLMLLTRNAVKRSTLRPVVTFGSPFVFCGGKQILDDLGLNDSHVHCVLMHRDIVPRAFSCNYPNHVATVLRRLHGSFQSHPCLLKNKLLYSPLGKLFILQPDEMSSPPHPLLPPGNALYTLDDTQSGLYRGALKAFLNRPHPLETLSDPTAYGSEGTILRDHDSSNYLKAMNGVLRRNTRMVDRKRRKPSNVLWPLLTSPSPHSWEYEYNLGSSRLATKKIMTSI